MKQTQATRPIHWPAILSLVWVAGCASGSWLESPSEAALPLDPPKQGYPTAVRMSLSDDEPAEEPADKWQLRPAANQSPPPAKPQPQQRLDAPSPPVPSMAVLPPQYVQRPPLAATPSPPTAESSLTSQLQSASAAMTSIDIVLPPATADKPAAQPPVVAPPDAPLAKVNPPNPQAQGASAAPVANVGLEIKEIDPQSRLADARKQFVESLEADIRKRRGDDPKDEELPRLEQELRLAYLAGGRLDDAVAAVDSLDPAQREAFKHLMFSLGVWLSPDESPRVPLRGAKILRSLRDATSELAAASKLDVRNLAFCTDVDSFGWYREFPRNEFQPKQQVILYVEVENFTAEKKSPTAFETELQGSYQIYNASGNLVAERQLELDKEVCRNYRRDYFLRYPIYMPADISAGKYRLELTLEDRKARSEYPGQKLGVGMIEFTIRQ